VTYVKSRTLPGEKTINILKPSYRVLWVLYPDKKLRHRELSRKSGVDKGNLSRFLKTLKDERLIEEDITDGIRFFTLTKTARNIIEVFIKVEKPEKPRWKPTPEEAALCLKALQEKGNPEMFNAAAIELSSTLKRGYWDSNLKNYFDNALRNPQNSVPEIKCLINGAFDKNKGLIAFLSRNNELLFKLVTKGVVAHLALNLYLKLSGDEALRNLDAALKKESASIVMEALRLNSVLFYQKFGLKAKQLLYETLKHPEKEIRESAANALREIVLA